MINFNLFHAECFFSSVYSVHLQIQSQNKNDQLFTKRINKTNSNTEFQKSIIGFDFIRSFCRELMYGNFDTADFKNF
jgi:hypothetical protein